MPADSFESPLTLAACGGHVELAELLISRGANIEEVRLSVDEVVLKSSVFERTHFMSYLRLIEHYKHASKPHGNDGG
jgi:hypothetical protein